MTSKASDPDTLVASAKAYLGALNKIVMKRQRDMPAAAASLLLVRSSPSPACGGGLGVGVATRHFNAAFLRCQYCFPCYAGPLWGAGINSTRTAVRRSIEARRCIT